jgi:two-component system, NarL family, invasion response regulator UvrY
LIKVLVVDDHDLVRTGIRRMLGDIRNMKVVGEARSGEEAVRVAKEVRPDVVLMDIKMEGIGGLIATKRILHADPDVKVLVVTVCEDEIFPVQFLEEGAVGYLTKGASMDEMVRAIRAVHSGQRYISPMIAQKLAFKEMFEKDESPFHLLTNRQVQVLIMIAQGYKPQEISKKLGLSPKTINSYRSQIFEKVGVKNDVELTLLAIRYGLIESPTISDGDK